MKTLVLDLDGTLVHVADHKKDNQSHVTLKMKVEEDEHRTVTNNLVILKLIFH